MADFEVRQAVHKVCPCALSASETEAKRIRELVSALSMPCSPQFGGGGGGWRPSG